MPSHRKDQSSEGTRSRVHGPRDPAQGGCASVAAMSPSDQPGASTTTRDLLTRWRDDPGGTYRAWFLWEERLKNFRSIRRGIQRVAAEIEAGAFGTQYRGSSLETVVGDK